MSQDTFPFAVDDDASYDESRSNRRAIVVAGGVAAALVLGAGGYFLLGGGSSDAANTAFVPPVHHTAVTGPKAVAAKPAVKVPTAYTAPLGRDPFKALYVVPAAAPAGAGTTTNATTTSITPTTTTIGTGTGSSTPVTTPVTSPTSTRYALKLVSISKPSPEVRFSTWSVDGKSSTVIPAQRFGKSGEIVVLAFGKNAAGVVDTAIIQVGDDSPVQVKIGQSVSVL